MMDQSILVLYTSLIFFILFELVSGFGTGIIKVQHKFAGPQRPHGSTLTTFLTHDIHRHGRSLSAIDFPLGGDSCPMVTGLYFAKIRIGSPPKDFYVQVDTGSDALWVSCEGCKNCPKKSSIMGGIQLSLYNPKDSSTSKTIGCDQDFCSSYYGGSYPGGCAPNMSCDYRLTYGDGSVSDGYYVSDNIQFNQTTGNLQTSPVNASIIFGCANKQSTNDNKGKDEGSIVAIDGIIGFGQSNSSVLSQLVSSGKVKKKIFSHCLDRVNDGGIFVIGEVVEPKVKTTPLLTDHSHYNINLKDIKVGNDSVPLPFDLLGFLNGFQRAVIIDSGTTLAYVPKDIHDSLIKMIFASHPNLTIQLVENQFKCFDYSANIDEGFPAVTFNFQSSVNLTIFPREYFFLNRPNFWCSGWQISTMKGRDGNDVILLGDLALSNKLFIYDLEKQAIGWTEYNCSSNIKLKDEKSGETYLIAANSLSSASNLRFNPAKLFMLFLSAMLHKFIIA